MGFVFGRLVDLRFRWHRPRYDVVGGRALMVKRLLLELDDVS